MDVNLLFTFAYNVMGQSCSEETEFVWGTWKELKILQNALKLIKFTIIQWEKTNFEINHRGICPCFPQRKPLGQKYSLHQEEKSGEKFGSDVTDVSTQTEAHFKHQTKDWTETYLSIEHLGP